MIATLFWWRFRVILSVMSLNKSNRLLLRKQWLSLTKGIEANTFSFMSDIIRSELPEVPYGVLSGPNLAKEIVAGQPAGTVIASQSDLVRYAVQQALHSALFRVFASDDVHGVETRRCA